MIWSTRQSIGLFFLVTELLTLKVTCKDMNFRRVYQIFWCKSLTFNETTLHQHHEIKRQAVANSHNQHHISVARNTIPFHSPHQTHTNLGMWFWQSQNRIKFCEFRPYYWENQTFGIIFSYFNVINCKIRLFEKNKCAYPYWRKSQRFFLPHL